MLVLEDLQGGLRPWDSHPSTHSWEYQELSHPNSGDRPTFSDPGPPPVHDRSTVRLVERL